MQETNWFLIPECAVIMHPIGPPIRTGFAFRVHENSCHDMSGA